MPDSPFLFDDLADDPALVLPADPVYTTPIEQATFDIMETADAYFRASMTVEEYDAVQRTVKKILTEAFGEKKETTKRALLCRTDR
jgi:hypothetical protein